MRRFASLSSRRISRSRTCRRRSRGTPSKATLAVVVAELRTKFALASPRIAVCGLNPHAGEGGHLGREEIDIIAPAIAAMRDAGHDVTGPFPADTIFVPEIARRFDAIVAMYHDQGLPVLKAASFGRGVNVTLGLPFIRTSVDHGTALDLAVDAAKAREADPGSLIAAVELAIELAGRAENALAFAASGATRWKSTSRGAALARISSSIPITSRGSSTPVAPQPGDRLVEIGPGTRRPDTAADRARRAISMRSKSTATLPRGSLSEFPARTVDAPLSPTCSTSTSRRSDPRCA
jgi:hypothetical protein